MQGLTFTIFGSCNKKLIFCLEPKFPLATHYNALKSWNFYLPRGFTQRPIHLFFGHPILIFCGKSRGMGQSKAPPPTCIFFPHHFYTWLVYVGQPSPPPFPWKSWIHPDFGHSKFFRIYYSRVATIKLKKISLTHTQSWTQISLTICIILWEV